MGIGFPFLFLLDTLIDAADFGFVLGNIHFTVV
jgi:hypothetical protein